MLLIMVFNIKWDKMYGINYKLLWEFDIRIVIICRVVILRVLLDVIVVFFLIRNFILFSMFSRNRWYVWFVCII